MWARRRVRSATGRGRLVGLDRCPVRVARVGVGGAGRGSAIRGIGRGSLLGRMLASAPGRDAVRDPADIREASGPEQRRGDTRPVAGRADRRDRAVAGQLVQSVGQRAAGDVLRARDVTALVLASAWRTSITSGRGRVPPRSSLARAGRRCSVRSLSIGRPSRSSSERRRGAWPTDRLVADAHGLADRPSQSPARSTTRTSGRSGSTTQPSHVPNDDPAGIESEPGICDVAWRTATEARRRGRPAAIAARARRRPVACDPEPRPPSSRGPSWLVGRIRAKYRGIAGWPAEQHPRERVHVRRADHRVVAALVADRRRSASTRSRSSRATRRRGSDRPPTTSSWGMITSWQRAVHRARVRDRVLRRRGGPSGRPRRRAASHR